MSARPLWICGARAGWGYIECTFNSATLTASRIRTSSLFARASTSQKAGSPVPNHSSARALTIKRGSEPGSQYISCIQTLLDLDIAPEHQADRSDFSRDASSWIKDHDEYKSWSDGSGEQRVLWIHGGSRAERSLLADFVSRDTLEQSDHPGEAAVIRFSFSARDTRRAGAFALLASLCRQLLLRKPKLFAHVATLYQSIADAADWRAGKLWVLFRSLLSCPEHVKTVCLIGGVDESDLEASGYLGKLLAWVAGGSHSMLGLLLTSGKGASEAASLAASARVVYVDLDNVMRDERAARAELMLEDEMLRLVARFPPYEEVCGVVTKKFAVELELDPARSPIAQSLRARLMLSLHTARKNASTGASAKALAGLELADLDASFEALFADIAATKERKWARSALGWLARAIRPLKSTELAVAVALDLWPHGGSLQDMEDVVSHDAVTDLRRILGQLVRVENGEVQLSDDSLREFLIRGHPGECKSDLCLGCCDGDAVVAQKCLRYLALLRVSSMTIPVRGFTKRQYDLVEYAVTCWPEHYRRAQHRHRQIANLDFDEYFAGDDLSDWAAWYWSFQHPSLQAPLPSALVIAADIGCQELVQTVLRRGPPEATDAIAALEVAITRGRRDVVRTLVLAGLPRPVHAVHLAASYGHEDLVAFLMAHGEEATLTMNTSGKSPLHCAAENGHVDIADVLLDPNIKLAPSTMLVPPHLQQGPTPLHLASQFGHVELVSMLLEKGSDSCCRDGSGSTPLHAACAWQQPDTVEALLTRSPPAMAIRSMKAVDNDYRQTPLHLAAANGRVDIVRLIRGHVSVSHPANVPTLGDLQHELLRGRDRLGRTPLHAAAAGGHSLVIDELLVYFQDSDQRKRAEYVTMPMAEGGTALHLAASNGHVEAAERLLKAHGQAIAVADHERRRPIHIAVSSGHVGMVKLLCQWHKDDGVSLAVFTNDGMSPLHMAVSGGHIDILKVLLRNGATAEIVDQHGATPLLQASGGGNLAMTRQLLAVGADATCRDSDGNSALHRASRGGHVRIVEELLASSNGELKEEQFINVLNNDERSPLHLAAEGGHADVARILLNAGARVHAERLPFKPDSPGSDKATKGSSVDATTALHLAAMNGHDDVAELLLQRGAQPDARDQHGNSALHLAAGSGHHMVVRTLAKRKVDVDARGDNSRTPLHLACERGHGEVIKILIRRGAQPTVQDRDGNMPIHVAKSEAVVRLLVPELARTGRDMQKMLLLLSAKRGYNEAIAEFLNLDGGTFDLNYTDENDDGCTPLLLAAREKNAGVVKLLLSRAGRVDANREDKNGRTALSYASQNGNVAVFDALLRVPDIDITVPDKEGETPLLYAAREGHGDIVRRLLDRIDGMCTDCRAQAQLGGGPNRRSPLWLASSNGHDAVVADLLARGADPNAPDLHKQTPLHIAAQKRHADVLKTLLGSPKLRDANARNYLDRTPLFLAAYFGSTRVVSVLVQHLQARGLKTDIADRFGWTPLHAAFDNAEIAAQLIDRGAADIDAVTDDGRTTLYLAVQGDRFDVARVLVSRGARVTICASGRETKDSALHLAAASVSDPDLFEDMLRSVGDTEDATVRDAEGVTALFRAVEAGAAKKVELLLDIRPEFAADIADANNTYGTPPILRAMDLPDLSIAQTLVGRVDVGRLLQSTCAGDLLRKMLEKAAHALFESLITRMPAADQGDDEDGDGDGGGDMANALFRAAVLRGGDEVGANKETPDAHGWRLADLLYVTVREADRAKFPPAPPLSRFEKPRAWSPDDKAALLDLDPDGLTVRYPEGGRYYLPCLSGGRLHVS